MHHEKTVIIKTAPRPDDPAGAVDQSARFHLLPCGGRHCAFAPVPVHISHMGMFAGGSILFGGPEKDTGLAALREACKPETPEKFPWTPHVTILIDRPETVHAALPVFVKQFVPFTGTITRLHLCAFWPTREIVAAELSGNGFGEEAGI